MITIFNGRRRTISEGKPEIYLQIDVAMRKHLHLFRLGNDLNSWAVFSAIALHANPDGWAWPSVAEIKRCTGLGTDEAVSRCIKHLRGMRIETHRILDHYRAKGSNNQWGKSYYHIFPSAGGFEFAPEKDLILWNGYIPTKNAKKPPPPISRGGISGGLLRSATEKAASLGFETQRINNA